MKIARIVKNTGMDGEFNRNHRRSRQSGARHDKQKLIPTEFKRGGCDEIGGTLGFLCNHLSRVFFPIHLEGKTLNWCRGTSQKGQATRVLEVADAERDGGGGSCGGEEMEIFSFLYGSI